MIRKSMICVALASMALATSCSQDDMASEYSLSKSPIKMNTSFGLSTRAVETTISNISSFRVSAFQDGKANYMSDVEYTSTNGSTWSTTAGSFFWPVSGDLRMYCYAPDQPGQSGTYTLDKDTQILDDFTPNTAASDQKDFVYAKATGNAAQNGSTGIDINFQHALSEITIAAKNSNKAYTVEVTGVKLGNITNKGTFTFPSVSGASASWTLSSSASDKQDYTTTWATPVALGDAATTMDAANVPFMLIPQQLEDADKASEGAYIAVKAKITMQGGQVVHDGWSYVGIDTKWEMGKRYAYTLDFSAGAGQDENGNPILSGSAIKLNCSVTPWDEIAENPEMSGAITIKDNCLIIDPNRENAYGINISEKINTFWASEEGDKNNLITSSTEWTAEVIWQDIDLRAINFCDKFGNVIPGDTYTGKGTAPLFVKPTNNVKGNVIIGVKKKGAGNDSYLWSWHLWLTDEPQEISGIMDRDLGAEKPAFDSPIHSLFYQFGRKDPFVRGTIYDINGRNPENIMKDKATATFAKAVNTPSTLYGNYDQDASNDDWVSPNNYKSKDWNDITDAKRKTFFDPCPKGWRIPESIFFEAFSYPMSDSKYSFGIEYKSNLFPFLKFSLSPDVNFYYWTATSPWLSPADSSVKYRAKALMVYRDVNLKKMGCCVTAVARPLCCPIRCVKE